MSIKIHEAYRIPVRKINEFLLFSRQCVIDNLKKRLPWLMTMYGEVGTSAVKINSRHADCDLQVKKRLVLRDMALRIYKKAKSDLWLRHDLDVEAWLDMWMDDRYAHIIPRNIHYVNLPNYAVDYSCQDQTDTPEGISPRQYTTRRKKWNELFLDNHNTTRLQHNIISFDRSISFVEICFAIITDNLDDYNFVEQHIR